MGKCLTAAEKWKLQHPSSIGFAVAQLDMGAGF
jgi:hypothetical protein